MKTYLPMPVVYFLRYIKMAREGLDWKTEWELPADYRPKGVGQHGDLPETESTTVGDPQDPFKISRIHTDCGEDILLIHGNGGFGFEFDLGDQGDDHVTLWAKGWQTADFYADHNTPYELALFYLHHQEPGFETQLARRELTIEEQQECLKSQIYSVECLLRNKERASGAKGKVGYPASTKNVIEKGAPRFYSARGSYPIREGHTRCFGFWLPLPGLCFGVSSEQPLTQKTNVGTSRSRKPFGFTWIPTVDTTVLSGPTSFWGSSWVGSTAAIGSYRT